MGFSFWTYLRVAEGAFLKIPAAKYNTFQHREAPLPCFSGREALVAELVVELENRRAVRFGQRWYRRFDLLASGLRDPESESEERSLYQSLVSVAEEEKSVIGELTSAKGRLLQRRLDVRFLWQPSPADLGGLAREVNGRAKRRLIGPMGPQLVT